MSDYVLSLSYGKDSLACLGAIQELRWPLTRIVHAEVWATDTIPADLPPMVDFKKKADAIIKERWGIEVEHISASNNFEKQFYSERKKSRRADKPVLPRYGWPFQKGAWCNDRLKVNILQKFNKDSICYIGIASNEPDRFHNLTETKISPLVAVGWSEDMCRDWCIKNDLLSPIYTTASRGGCWFCHNQGVDQLRILRKTYPEYWALMLKWDSDSPVPFHADGHTVYDFERRFLAEDECLIEPDLYFRWEMLSDPLLNYRLLRKLIYGW